MALKVYYTALSPPSRAVLIAVKALELDVEYINVDLMKGEHLDPEYLKVSEPLKFPQFANSFIVA